MYNSGAASSSYGSGSYYSSSSYMVLVVPAVLVALTHFYIYRAAAIVAMTLILEMNLFTTGVCTGHNTTRTHTIAHTSATP